MSRRYCYLGRTFTAADNPRLPYPIRCLPDGTVYGQFNTGDRRLPSICMRHGISVSSLADVEILIRTDGVLLVGDEIAKGKMDSSKVEP